MLQQATRSIIVKGETSRIYDLWANFEDFPRFMKPVKSIRKTGERTSHWVVEGPLGKTIEWDAETTTLERNKRIAWNSTGGDIKTTGQVTFTDLPQSQTQVTITLQYVPQAGAAAEVVDKIFGDLDQRLLENLRDFKTYAEGKAAQ